jgi:hypothetical protein
MTPLAWTLLYVLCDILCTGLLFQHLRGDEREVAEAARYGHEVEPVSNGQYAFAFLMGMLWPLVVVVVLVIWGASWCATDRKRRA